MSFGLTPISSPGASAGPGVTRPRVLLVEDDPSTAGLMSELLRHVGCDVVAVATVGDALDALDHFAFRYVLLDLMLPDGEGTPVLASVRSHNLPTKVLVVSATGDDQLLARVERQKPDAILQKPLDFNRLLKAMNLPARL